MFYLCKRNIIRVFRQSIYENFDHECVYCGAIAESLDHAKPKAKGGETISNNLLPACKSCNQDKGSQELFEWYKRRKSWTQDRENIIRNWIDG